MDHKEIAETLSKSLNRNKGDINKLLDALSNVTKERCSELDNIIIPRFGTIETIKHNEVVEVDPESGKRMLVPPHIDVQFSTSNVFKKKLNHQT